MCCGNSEKASFSHIKRNEPATNKQTNSLQEEELGLNMKYFIEIKNRRKSTFGP
jgi:hypothetical protein